METKFWEVKKNPEAAIAEAAGLITTGWIREIYPVRTTAEAALARASQAGIIVVRSSRTGCGAVLPAEQSYLDAHFLQGDTLNPQKARILLQLALTKTNDPKEIQRMFDEY